MMKGRGFSRREGEALYVTVASWVGFKDHLGTLLLLLQFQRTWQWFFEGKEPTHRTPCRGLCHLETNQNSTVACLVGCKST